MIISGTIAEIMDEIETTGHTLGAIKVTTDDSTKKIDMRNVLYIFQFWKYDFL